MLIDAVFTSSVSNERTADPDDEKGSSFGFSEYLSKTAGFTLSKLTFPMVQLEKERRSISS